MTNFIELNREELDTCSGGGPILACLAIAGCFIGGVAIGAGVTIGVVKFCQWINA